MSNENGKGRPPSQLVVTALLKTERETPGDFRAVYHEHFDFVWRSLRRLGAPENCLEDLAQDVFVVVARRLDDFENRSSVRTWIFAIAARVVRTHRRTLERRDRKISALAHAQDPANVEQMSKHDARHLLLRMLDELPPGKREIYVLVEIEGVSITEIAAELEVNENTLRTRLRSARKQMAAIAERLLSDERKHR